MSEKKPVKGEEGWDPGAVTTQHGFHRASINHGMPGIPGILEEGDTQHTMVVVNDYAGKCLITYRSEHDGEVMYGMDIADDPIQWLADCQDYPETYVLINVCPMTSKQAAMYDGAFKGM